MFSDMFLWFSHVYRGLSIAKFLRWTKAFSRFSTISAPSPEFLVSFEILKKPFENSKKHSKFLETLQFYMFYWDFFLLIPKCPRKISFNDPSLLAHDSKKKTDRFFAKVPRDGHAPGCYRPALENPGQKSRSQGYPFTNFIEIYWLYHQKNGKLTFDSIKPTNQKKSPRVTRGFRLGRLGQHLHRKMVHQRSGFTTQMVHLFGTSPIFSPRFGYPPVN